MPVRCPSHELLASFCANGLSAAEDDAIATHLDQCVKCRQTLESLTSLDHSFIERGTARLPVMGGDEQSLADLRLQLYRLGDHSDSVELDWEETPHGSDATVIEGATNFPQQVGRFIIEGTLGEGGFGVVLLAHDPTLKRKVALKIPRLHMLGSEVQKRRFLREARATAALHHPNIIPVFDAGDAEGIAYLASAYCPGPTLSRWLADQPELPAPKQAARIVLALANAVEHAHQQGILHRDIKPSNVLLDPQGAGTELPFTPRLADFGLAKLLESDEDATLTGMVIGTPRYMAPEQAAAQRDQIGPTTDIYSLGAVLYQLLTGKPPITGGDNADTLRRILSELPVAPRRVVATVPLDLEAIALKCLEKRPADRYPTAQQLADDLERFLRGEPTLARPLPRTARVQRWCRRNPVAAILFLVLLLVAVVAPLLAYRQAQLAQSEREARNQAEQSVANERAARQKADSAFLQEATAREDAQRKTKELESNQRELRLRQYHADLDLAERAWREGNIIEAIRYLDKQLPVAGSEDLRTFDWFLLHRRCNEYTWRIPVNSTLQPLLALTPNGKRLAIVTYLDQFFTIAVYDLPSRQLQREIKLSHKRPISDVQFSPDEKQILLQQMNSPENLLVHTETRSVKQLSHKSLIGTWMFRESNEPLFVELAYPELKLERTTLTEFTFSPDRQWLIVLNNAKKGYSLLISKIDEQNATFISQIKTTLANRFHAFGSKQFYCYFPNSQLGDQIQVVDYRDSSNSKLFLDLPEPMCELAISRDDSTLATVNKYGVIHFWETARPQLRATRQGHRKFVATQGYAISLANSDDPDLWVSAMQNEVLLWDLKAPVAYESVAAHQELVWMAGATQVPRVVTAGRDGEIKVWNTDTGKIVSTFQAERQFDRAGSITADGTLVAFPNQNGDTTLWEIGQPAARATLPGNSVRLNTIKFSPDGSQLATGTTTAPKRNMALWNVSDARLERRLEGHPMVFRNVDQVPVKIDPDRSSSLTSMAYFRDGTMLATGGDDARIRFWDITSGDCVREFPDQVHKIFDIALSPVNKMMASGGQDAAVRLWSVEDGQLLAELKGHTGPIYSLAFSPDGKTLASASTDKTIRLWSLLTNQTVTVINDCESSIRHIAFVDQGKTLVGSSGDHKLHFWRTER